MDETHPETIDGRQSWNEAEGDRRRSAAPGAYGKADLLARFFDRVGVPDDVASFGCGPAENLYARVRDGGHLVFNYPNRLTLAEYRRLVAGEADEELADAEAFRERFGLVFEGENLLSDERIREVLGAWPRSYWAAVGAPDERWTGRTNPCVYLPK